MVAKVNLMAYDDVDSQPEVVTEWGEEVEDSQAVLGWLFSSFSSSS